jgi:hypothetical protein
MMRQKDAKTNVSLLDYINSYVIMIRHDIRIVSLISKQYKNNIRLFFNVMMKRYPITVTTNNGDRLVFHNFESFYNNLLGLSFDSDRNIVRIRNHSFCGGMAHGDNIAGVFLREEYNFLDVMGKIVIDVGAGIGDSAVYFAESGADKVISIEADKTNYELAKKNIEVNDVNGNVELIWAACSAQGAGYLKNVPTISLSEVLDSFSSGELLALKIDCEGCEYEILASLSKDILDRVSDIQIEYHYGYRNLKRKLESCNFHVKVTRPRYFRPRNLKRSTIFYDNVERRNESMFLGWIYATKQR